MARQERESPRSPENGGLIRIDPAELMRDNPAALILNQDSYDRMKGHFSPEMFDPPQVVRVSTFSSIHGRETKLFVVDGLTRTRFAAEHKGATLPEAPDYKFDTIAVKDVTDSVLANPTLVPLTEKEEDQTEITMLQYLRAVVPPTAKHVEIAPDRIAAHLVNGWDNMVGVELSNKYSALAALSFLDDQRVPVASETELKRFLGEQDEIMAGNTPDEKAKLTQGLVDMVSIMQQSKLMYRQVAESAFALISAGSPVVGGDNESRRQIYGLLRSPEIERKLLEAYPNKGERDHQRIELGDLIAATFKDFASREDSQALSGLQTSLGDSNLSLDDVRTVLGAERPHDAYTKIKEDLNAQRIERYYLSRYRKEELSPFEATLIDRVGRKRFLNDNEMQTLAQNISAAENVMQQAYRFVERLTQERDQLIREGVRPQTIEEATPFIQEAIEQISNAYSLAQIAQRTTDLHTKVNDTENRFSGQMTTKRVGTMVDQVFGSQLRTSRGSMIRRGAIVYILREVDTSDNAAIMKRLTDLSRLDSDLQSQVLNGDIRISHALRLQQGRRAPEPPTILPPAITTPVENLVSVASPAPIEPVETPTAPIEIPSGPEPDMSEEERALFDRQAAESRRRELNNQRLDTGIASMRTIIREVDLSVDEMSPATKNALDQMIREIGRFRFNHPDMVRVMEEYDRVQEELTQLRASQLIRQEADTFRDTRTRR